MLSSSAVPLVNSKHDTKKNSTRIAFKINMASTAWKNASTLIVAARNHLGHNALNNTRPRFAEQFKFNYNVMLLKRSAKSQFFAKAFVFPGGGTEAADFAPSWLEHFADSGFSRDTLHSQFVQKRRPPIYGNPTSDCIPEIGYRITAIRETFEETGVLFCKAVGQGPRGSINLQEWQQRVYQNPPEFLRLCREHSLCPDIWSLYEWANWLTPDNMAAPKRYDTIFYLCVVDDVPAVAIDGKEITQVRWIDPAESVWEHVQGNIRLAPPQVYELSRLAHFDTSDRLREFAERRQLSGVERWLPVAVPTTNGVMTVLPGDDLYPSDDGQSKLPTAAEDEINFEITGANRNRMLFSKTGMRVGCNITDPCGHQQPMNLVDLMTDELSASDNSSKL